MNYFHVIWYFFRKCKCWHVCETEIFCHLNISAVIHKISHRIMHLFNSKSTSIMGYWNRGVEHLNEYSLWCNAAVLITIELGAICERKGPKMRWVACYILLQARVLYCVVNHVIEFYSCLHIQESLSGTVKSSCQDDQLNFIVPGQMNLIYLV